MTAQNFANPDHWKRQRHFTVTIVRTVVAPRPQQSASQLPGPVALRTHSRPDTGDGGSAGAGGRAFDSSICSYWSPAS